MEPSKASHAFQLPPTSRETEAPEKGDLLVGSVLLLLTQGSLWPTSDDFIFIFLVLCMCTGACMSMCVVCVY